jgi:hypothetical protein
MGEMDKRGGEVDERCVASWPKAKLFLYGLEVSLGELRILGDRGQTRFTKKMMI